MKIDVKVDLKAVEELEKKLGGTEGKAAVMRGLKAGAFLIQSTAQQSILAGGKTGKQYGKHRASAPGEAPASDTGTLVRGITARVGSEPLSYEVHSVADYAGFLEYGTSKMAARPYMQPAATKSADKIVKLVADELMK